MNAIVDLLQAILLLAGWIVMILLSKRVSLLSERSDQNARAVTQVRESFGQSDPQPICGCEHHKCFHDEESCGNAERVYDGFNWKILTCGCKGYMGPEQLPKVIP